MRLRKALTVLYVASASVYVMTFPYGTAAAAASLTISILAAVAVRLTGRVGGWVAAVLLPAVLTLLPVDPQLTAPFIPMLAVCVMDNLRVVRASRDVLGAACACLTATAALMPDPVHALLPGAAAAALLTYLIKDRLRRGRHLILLTLSYSLLGASLCFIKYPPLTPFFTALAVGAAVVGVSALKPSVKSLRTGVRVLRRPPKSLKPFITADLIVAGVFDLNYVAGICILGLYRGSALGVAGAVVASYGLVGMLYYVYRLLTPRPEVVMKPLKSRWYTAFLIARSSTYRLLTAYASRLARLMELAAYPENPVIFAARYVTAAIIAGVAAPPLALTAYVVTHAPWTAAIAVTPLIIPLMPYLYLRQRIDERRRAVEDELPWLAVYASCMQAAGITLTESMRRLVGKGLLPAVEREGRYVLKHVIVLGKDYLTALEDIASKHPSRLFRDFVMGYTSILRTGGNLLTFLEAKTKELTEWLGFRFRKYADTAVSVAELLTALFTIFVSVFAIAGSSNPTLVTAMSVAGIPLIAVVMYGMISSVQPRIRLMLTTRHFIPAVAVFVAAVALARLGINEWLSGAVVALVMGMCYGVQYVMQLRVVRDHEEALEDFLRDVAELRKIGLPPSKAILSLARTRTYNKHFDTVLKQLATQLRLSIPLGEAVKRVWTPSWLTRMTLFIIAEVEASGGGSPKVLTDLTEFLSSYIISRKEMVSKLRVYEFLVMLTPLILGFFISISSALASLFTPQLHSLTLSGSGAYGKLFVPMVTGAGIRAARIAALESSLAMAVLASKTIDFTVRNTLRVAVVALIFIIYNLIMDPIVRSLVTTWFSMPSI